MPLKPLRLRIRSDPANLSAVRKAVEVLAMTGGFDAIACGEIALCVNEALANVIRHAYEGAMDQPIEILAEMTGAQIRIRIRDWGNGVNPDELPPAEHDPLTPGGLGLICLRRMMDDVRFIPQSDGGMVLEMSRRNIRR